MADIRFDDDVDDVIEHCLTGNVICRILKNTNVQPFNFEKPPQSNYNGNFPKENSLKRKDSFRKIVQNGAWGSNHGINNFNYNSSSGLILGFSRLIFEGEGSTLFWSQEITAVLHNLIYKIKSNKTKNYVIRMLDVPCGDMVWMKRFLESRNDINYTGIDVVPELISSHKKNFKNKNWKFYVQDIVDVKSLGFYDIILCRMLLQHLYSGDILRILQLFSDSGSSFLISTTYPSEAINEELNLQQSDNPGRYRKVNLELPPFSLIAPICICRDGPIYNRELNTHYVAVWRLPLINVIDCLDGYSHFVDVGGAKILYNSCSKKYL
ncbi:hypothetical protein HELRODRAFT_167827 [Helobdella robusta]|uniref:Methyltransferase domain-containing protein n=1 Tax=Helobdella robusta TaxID=6412 RepID=T1EZU6_HELRO|nr:hypothetical protein HELRODRAFT_167827 [Helobdella robusta]ESO09992.1 hypothetical protein HELRODRAFT_167827 [Helobdella robusta]